MKKKETCHPKVLELLNKKASVKQEVFRKSQEYFKSLKLMVENVAAGLEESYCKLDDTVKILYKDKGPFECELHFSGDVLLFNMHTNVFTFEKNHQIWKTGYVREDNSRAYFAMINIYNFLADSIRYKRSDDAGILLGRIFVNREGHFFVEGKRQLSFLYNHLGKQVMNDNTLKELIDTAIIYSLEYDLTVPDYHDVMLVSVRQIQAMSDEIHLKTSKKVGLGYYTRMQNK